MNDHLKIINVFMVILALAFLSCHSAKQNVVASNHDSYSIIESKIVSDQDTIIVSELRMYEIKSALDGTRLMFENYGPWNEKSEGKYQTNINQMAWFNVKLFEDDRTYFVISDGTETDVSYFASLIILDSENRNCLSRAHPLRKELVNLMLEKLNKLSNSSDSYDLFH
jgi:hypothetical protein